MNTVAPLDITQSLEPLGAEVLTNQSPVFVDTTGRRRRLVRITAGFVSACCLLYIGLLAYSLLTGGSVGLNTLFPAGEAAAATRTGTAPTPDAPRPDSASDNGDSADSNTSRDRAATDSSEKRAAAPAAVATQSSTVTS